MKQEHFHVIVVGGGLGGLCLAQGLKKAGISVALYERNRTRNERLQGYRIHLEAMGNRALQACLPRHLFEVYLKTTGSGGGGLRMSDEKLHKLVAFEMSPKEQDDPETSRSVSRITLRQLLLTELDDIVHFNKVYSHYQKNVDGTVTAFFEDGTSATGNLLVAADGGNSRIRQQFLPQAKRVETGTTAIMGKVPLTPELKAVLKEQQLDWATIVLGPNGRGFFSAVHNLSDNNTQQVHEQIGVNEDALLSEAGALFENTSDYYFWAFLTRKKNYPLQSELEQLPGSELLQIAKGMTSSWHPKLQHLLEQTDPSTVIATPLRIATQVAPWDNENITLLGDAIHSMPPTRGIGGNVALRDAHLLCQKLMAVAQKEKTQRQAMHEYVTEMLRYSFAAVKSSKQSLDMIVMENSVGRAFTKTMLRGIGVFSSQRSA